LRKTGERSTEEIDVVGMARGRVVVVGEATWRNATMDVGYLAEIEDYKLPALRQTGLKVATAPGIVLFSRGGYTDGLRPTPSKAGSFQMRQRIELRGSFRESTRALAGSRFCL
jgi:hypothetical protein